MSSTETGFIIDQFQRYLAKEPPHKKASDFDMAIAMAIGALRDKTEGGVVEMSRDNLEWLACIAYLHAEISLGRLAELLGVTRQDAAAAFDRFLASRTKQVSTNAD